MRDSTTEVQVRKLKALQAQRKQQKTEFSISRPEFWNQVQNVDICTYKMFVAWKTPNPLKKHAESEARKPHLQA